MISQYKDPQLPKQYNRMSCTGLGSPLTCTYKQTPLLKTRFESCQGLNCWGGFLETSKQLGDEDQDFHGISGTFGFTLQGTNISYPPKMAF